MLAAGDDIDTLLEGYPCLEREEIQACLSCAQRLVGHGPVDLSRPFQAASKFSRPPFPRD